MALRDDILNNLPGEVRDLLHRITRESGREIDFRALGPGEGPERAAAGCQIVGRNAVVLIRNPDEVRPSSVLHELLHLQRYWLEGVPQLVGVGDHNNCAAKHWENGLEHLVIIPRQTDYGLRDEARWNGWARDDWAAWDPRPLERRTAAVMGWLGLAVVTDRDVVRVATEKLQYVGLLEDARAFRAKAKRLKANKPLLAAHLIETLRLRREHFRLWYADDAGGYVRELPHLRRRRRPAN